MIDDNESFQIRMAVLMLRSTVSNTNPRPGMGDTRSNFFPMVITPPLENHIAFALRGMIVYGTRDTPAVTIQR
jgi:hypothetical protein